MINDSRCSFPADLRNWDWTRHETKFLPVSQRVRSSGGLQVQVGTHPITASAPEFQKRPFGGRGCASWSSRIRVSTRAERNQKSSTPHPREAALTNYPRPIPADLALCCAGRRVLSVVLLPGHLQLTPPPHCVSSRSLIL